MNNGIQLNKEAEVVYLGVFMWWNSVLCVCVCIVEQGYSHIVSIM